MVTATAKHLSDKIAQYGISYEKDLELCIVERRTNGDIVCDNTHPAWKEMLAKYRKNTQPAQPQPQYPNGLGTLVTHGIDAASFGLAKPVATSIAKVFGAKTCSCNARAACLNQLVPDVRKVDALGWLMLSSQILACIGAKR